jgi:acyl transferase domain-containing protein/acyl carrier protein
MSQPEELEQLEDSGIAVIGLSGRFPGARGVQEFWKNLCDGIESIEVYSDEQLLAAGVDPELLKNPNYVKASPAVDDIELFDAGFFGYSPREAETMDHQHRLFLEAAWEALEVAGYNPDDYPGSIGVFAGVKNPSPYLLFNLLPNAEVHESTDSMQLVFGNSGDYLPTLVSYKLNLRGPSYLIQTACSTSLVAIHVACQNILSGECQMALAGGVSINSKHRRGYLFREGGIQSPDGHTRAFDEKAQGVVSGEGLGIVVLKALADARADGDRILAVIKGSACNNDGSLKIGFTAPSIEGQSQVIAEAQAMAGIDPDTVTYIETHGTGTVLGDPIEIAALTKAFRMRTDRKQFCAIGSVKTNVGHLDTAAGVAGFIKTVLSLDQKMLPPSLNFEKPNPKLDLANSPFFVNTKLASWTANGTPRRAGVSSFGVGGTNAHVVLEEAPAPEPSISKRSQQLLVLSARTSTALEVMTSNLRDHLEQNPTANLSDVAYTLQVGRKGFPHRRAVICETTSDAIAALGDPKRMMTGLHDETTRPLVMMFSGQGTQYVNMTRGIYESEPAFREQVDQCCSLLEKTLHRDLRTLLYPLNENDPDATELLQQTRFTQPALFVIEYSLARMLMAWGLEPQALMGHSIGEYVAACLSGVLSLEDALTVVAARGSLMQEMQAGAMLAVKMTSADALKLVSDEISLAAVNAPSLCVISGSVETINQAEKTLSERGIFCRPLHTSHAFHSHMMEPIVNRFVDQMSTIKLHAPKIPYLSNVTGDWITDREATDPRYWGRHLRGTVQFAASFDTLFKDGPHVLLEVGPGETLLTFARQCAGANSESAFVSTIPHQSAQQSDTFSLMKALGALFVEGQKINWESLHDGESLHRTTLPTYPFERQRYWIDPPSVRNQGTRLGKNPDVAEWFYVPSWKRSSAFASKDHHDATWLVFVDECGLGDQVAKQLLAAGQQVVTVRKGEEYSQAGFDTYVIDPASQRDYEFLFSQLHHINRVPTRIAHLWNVTPELTQENSFYELLYLAQALAKYKPNEPLSIAVVSNNVHEVTGEESLSPEKATLVSFCKVIPRELAGVYCRAVDVVLPGTPRDEAELVRQLIAEFDHKALEPVVAYRGRHRWVQSYERIRLDEPNNETVRLRASGTYLITGGLGGVGLALAEYLARAVSAKLILTSLSGLGAEDQRTRKIEELRELGAEVLIVKADASDFASMRSVLAQAEERFGPIHGVVHAAGVMGGGLAELKTDEMVRDVFAPKIDGTRVLYQLLKDRPVDFVLLCSSITAVTGAMGQLDYCAANAFMDSFAQAWSARSENFVTSINFPAWRETGMAVRAAEHPDFGELVKKDLQHGMLTSEALDACGRILSSNVRIPQVVVSPQALGPLLEQHLRQTGKGVAVQQAAPPPAKLKAYARPQMKNEYVPPETEMEKVIVEYWKEIIGVDLIGVHDNFLELGGHSLMAVQLLSRLRDKFHVDLPVRSFFDSPTVADLVLLIEQEQQVQSPTPANTIELIARPDQTLESLLRELED